MSDGTPRRDVTALLADWSRGDQRALNQLIPEVTSELRRIARRFLDRELPSHTLQPTALINELYLKLLERRKMSWRDRQHFFAFAARIMRRILIDHARARKTSKRGGGLQPLALDEARDRAKSRDYDVLELHDALKSLALLDPRQGRIVELRTFAGLSLREIAEVLEVSVATVSRDWASAKAWLYGELARG